MAAVKTRNTATLMTEGSIVKSLLLFALPLIFGNLLQQMYNTADSIIVGNFVGSNALAAVGSSGSPIYLLIGFSQIGRAHLNSSHPLSSRMPSSA